MVDFVLFIVTAILFLALGFACGYYYSINRLKYDDIDYNVNIIKEDIVALTVRFNHIEGLLRDKAEDKSL
jgi:hypothetical protein